MRRIDADTTLMSPLVSLTLSRLLSPRMRTPRLADSPERTPLPRPTRLRRRKRRKKRRKRPRRVTRKLPRKPIKKKPRRRLTPRPKRRPPLNLLLMFPQNLLVPLSRPKWKSLASDTPSTLEFDLVLY